MKMTWETEHPTLVKIIGACVSAVMFVGSTLVPTGTIAAHGLELAAGMVLGAVGLQIAGKAAQ